MTAEAPAPSDHTPPSLHLLFLVPTPPVTSAGTCYRTYATTASATLQTNDTPLTTWGISILEPADRPTGTTAAAHMPPVHPPRSVQVLFDAETTCGMYAIAPATTADAPARHDGRRARAV